MRMVRVSDVEPLEGFKVRLRFTDGTRKEIDLRPFLHGPVFEPLLQSPEEFRSVRIDAELGTIVWGNGADIDPDVLFRDLTPAWMEDTARR
jgi:uncharacterized protein DUF2442